MVLGVKRQGYIKWGETTRVEKRGETTRGKTTRGKRLRGETSCYRPRCPRAEMVLGRNDLEPWDGRTKHRKVWLLPRIRNGGQFVKNCLCSNRK